MDVRSMEAGDRIRHPTRPDWGIGQVLGIDSSKAAVFFVEAGHKNISLQHVSLTVLEPRPSHPLLDAIDRDAAGGGGYRSVSRSIQGFLETYPEGFHGKRFMKLERKYKIEAHELATAVLGRAVLEPLLAAGEFAEICRRAMQVVNKTNLIFPNEKMSLKDGLKPADGEEGFAVALFAMLHGENALRSRFKQFASVLDRLGAAKWTVATYFPFLLYPDRHQFIKPTYIKNAAAICAFDIAYTSTVDWTVYERMLRFSDYLKSELERAGLKPRDNIDVQSFMYCIALPSATQDALRRTTP